MDQDLEILRAGAERKASAEGEIDRVRRWARRAASSLTSGAHLMFLPLIYFLNLEEGDLTFTYYCTYPR